MLRMQLKQLLMFPHNHSKNAKDDDFLDRHLIGKADLDYIPGLDYDLGPVFIPSRDFIDR